MVYFFGFNNLQGVLEAVKIGYTEDVISMESRMRALRPAYPGKIYILGLIHDGDKAMERELHRVFTEMGTKIHHELFGISKDLFDVIEEFCDAHQHIKWEDLKNHLTQNGGKIYESVRVSRSRLAKTYG